MPWTKKGGRKGCKMKILFPSLEKGRKRVLNVGEFSCLSHEHGDFTSPDKMGNSHDVFLIFCPNPKAI